MPKFNIRDLTVVEEQNCDLDVPLSVVPYTDYERQSAEQSFNWR
jgi:hypothetical protein